MHCVEKYRLLDLHKAKVAAHWAAVNDMTLLNLKGGSESQQESDRLWSIVDKTKGELETASLVLFQHTQEHGC